MKAQTIILEPQSIIAWNHAGLQIANIKGQRIILRVQIMKRLPYKRRGKKHG
jgi:hypothetical protein